MHYALVQACITMMWHRFHGAGLHQLSASLCVRLGLLTTVCVLCCCRSPHCQLVHVAGCDPVLGHHVAAHGDTGGRLVGPATDVTLSDSVQHTISDWMLHLNMQSLID
jgi:hypothetical protein